MHNVAMTTVLGVMAPVLSAIILIYLGRRDELGYDSFWHIFIARQDNWSRFWFEVRDNAHPPLFELVLKAVIPFGHTLLVYRVPSILSIVIATVLIFTLARRAVANPWWAGVSAVAFGLSYTAINIGLEVRPYALATCLTLVALHYYLSLAESGFSRQAPKERVLFALFIALALLTHYSVAFVLVASVLSPLVLAAANRAFRVRLGRALTTALPANILTFGGPLAALVFFYVQHVRFWVGRIGHLPEFLFDPRSERVIVFAARTVRAEIELFLPSAASGLVMFAAVATLGAAVFLCLTTWRNGRPEGQQISAMMLPVMLGIMGVLALAAAIAGRYPFGGTLRHQFFMFPFVILSTFVTLDRIEASLPTRTLRRALVAAVNAGCAVSIVGWMISFSLTPSPPFQSQMATLQTLVPNQNAVYVAQFSLIPLFMYHHDWDWRLKSPASVDSSFGVWTASKDGQEFLVCRDLGHWLLDISDAGLYSNLERCLGMTGAPRVTLLQVGGNGFPTGLREPEASALIERLALKAGLRSVSLVTSPESVIGQFEPGLTPRPGSSSQAR